jgi:hypothetical protein
MPSRTPNATATPIVATAPPSANFTVESLSTTRYINSSAGRVNLRGGREPITKLWVN